MRKVQTQYTVVMGDFNAKVGKKQVGEQAIGNYGIDSRNARGEMLVEFAERNRLRIMNTFFRKRSNRKWTWKSPNGETRNEIDFILSADPSIVQDVEVLGKVKCSDHRLVRSRISLNLKRERVKLVKRKQANLEAVRVKADQFRLVLANKYAALEQEDEDNIDVMNETITRLISEAAIEVGGKAPRQPVGKLSQETKDLIKKRQNMKVSNSRDQIEFAELSKLINKKKVRDIRNYNVGKIEEAVKYGRSMKSVRRKLGIGQGKMYALKDKHGNIISNFDDIVKAAEEFYTDLYSAQTTKRLSFEIVMNRIQRLLL